MDFSLDAVLGAGTSPTSRLPGSYDTWLAHGQSTTANVLFAVHLARLGVPAYSLHAGAILTPLGRHLQERVRARPDDAAWWWARSVERTGVDGFSGGPTA